MLDSLHYCQKNKGIEIVAIKDNPQESRKEFLLKQFQKAGAMASNVSNYQFWRHDNRPIKLWSNKVIDEK